MNAAVIACLWELIIIMNHLTSDHVTVYSTTGTTKLLVISYT